MDYRKKFLVSPGKEVDLGKIDPSATVGYASHDNALPEIRKHVARMDELQYLLYADGSRSLLVVLQALDAAGKDGTIRHLFSSAFRGKARSSSSTVRTMRMCWSPASTTWCRRRSGRSATT